MFFIIFIYILFSSSFAKEQIFFDSSSPLYSFPEGFHPKLSHLNCEWNKTTGVARINANVTFGTDDEIEEFFWQVPKIVKTIIINANTTVIGGFRTDHSLCIRGENRQTSKIFGTFTKQWKMGRVKDGWRYPAISAKRLAEGEELHIKSLTLENSRTFNVHSSDSKIVVDECTFINTRGFDELSNNDGFTGGPGSIIKNSFLAVNDDIIKIYQKNMTVENVTIYLHSRNSVAFQMGWDDNPDSESSATLRNVLVIGAAPNMQRGRLCKGGLFFDKPGYNKGIFVWKGGFEKQTRLIILDGFKVTGLNEAYMFSPLCQGWMPLPLVNIWRPNGKILLNGNNVFISTPTSSYPIGEVSANLCGEISGEIKNKYNCGTDNVAGDSSYQSFNF